MATLMTIPDIIALIMIVGIVVYGLAQWAYERKMKVWERLQDEFHKHPGWPT